MPFGSYELSPEHALANAHRLVKEAGADAVKVALKFQRSLGCVCVCVGGEGGTFVANFACVVNLIQ